MAQELREELHPYWKAINWNEVDDFDKEVWDKLTSQFWLDTKIPLSNDIPSWNKLSEDEKNLVMRVFSGLTLLDTIQSRFGAASLAQDATSLFEESVYNNIIFMETVHAKSYSSIFTTLSDTPHINEAFEWSDSNEYLRKKADTVMTYYKNTAGEDPKIARVKKKVASVFLESFLFYSGFYLPLWLNAHAKLTNTGDIIRLIMRDEAVHGYFIGQKFQDEIKELGEDVQSEIKDWAFELLLDLYDNEVLYTQSLYDTVGLTEDVKIFLRYNANRALMNLGFEPLFPAEDVNPLILKQLEIGGESHDFFSGSGSSYIVASAGEGIDDDDWDFD